MLMKISLSLILSREKIVMFFCWYDILNLFHGYVFRPIPRVKLVLGGEVVGAGRTRKSQSLGSPRNLILEVCFLSRVSSVACWSLFITLIHASLMGLATMWSRAKTSGKIYMEKRIGVGRTVAAGYFLRAYIFVAATLPSGDGVRPQLAASLDD